MSTSIARRMLFLVATVWLGVQGWNEAPAAAAATTVLESSVLRLEVTDAPYSFAVIEKSTGQILLRHAQTTFNVGTARSASTAAIGRKTATASKPPWRSAGSAEHGARPVDVRQPLRRASPVESGQGDEHHRSVRRSGRAQLRALGVLLLRHGRRARQPRREQPAVARALRTRRPAAATPAAARRSTSRRGSTASTPTRWPWAGPPSPSTIGRA